MEIALQQTVSLNAARLWYLVSLAAVIYVLAARFVFDPLLSLGVEWVYLALKKRLPVVCADREALTERLLQAAQKYDLPRFTVVERLFGSRFNAEVHLKEEPCKIIASSSVLNNSTVVDMFILAHEAGHLKSSLGDFYRTARAHSLISSMMCPALFCVGLPALLAGFQETASLLLLSILVSLAWAHLHLLLIEAHAHLWGLRFMRAMGLLNLRTLPPILLAASIGMLSYTVMGVFFLADELKTAGLMLNGLIRARKAEPAGEEDAEPAQEG